MVSLLYEYLDEIRMACLLSFFSSASREIISLCNGNKSSRLALHAEEGYEAAVKGPADSGEEVLRVGVLIVDAVLGAAATQLFLLGCHVALHIEFASAVDAVYQRRPVRETE